MTVGVVAVVRLLQLLGERAAYQAVQEVEVVLETEAVLLAVLEPEAK